MIKITSALAAVAGASLVAAAPNQLVGRAPSGWSDLGCVQDGTPHLISTLAYQGDQNSPAHCTKLCGDNMYPYAAVSGTQCYCGHQLDKAGDVGSTLPAASCNAPCPGDKAQTCGGTNILQAFQQSSAGASGASSAASSPSASASASGASAAAPAASSSPASASTDLPAGNGAASISGQLSAPASSAKKYVWAHHMVGNTEYYAASNWTDDVTQAKEAGIDGFALNMGADAYQPQNVEWAYAAAQSAGDFYAFFSFDMTSFPCKTSADAQKIADLAKKYAAHPAQAKYNGKPIVSTFGGETCTFGAADVTAGWASVRKAIGDIYFIPSTFMKTDALKAATWFDGQVHWDAAWPMDGSPISTKPDLDWMTAMGADKIYMASVSPFFFTYYGKDSWDKNWIYRSDDWLFATRFEQVIGMRDKIDMIELLSWNDFGESHYLRSVPADPKFQPKSEGWTTGMPHEGLLSMVKVYADAFRSGSLATPSDDGLWLWTRPHPKDAKPTAPKLARPNRSDYTEDALYAVVNLASKATVKIWSGDSTQSWDLDAGISKVRVPSKAGEVGGSVQRDGKDVITFASGDFKYTDTPVDYNFNYFVGEATKPGQSSGSGSGKSSAQKTHVGVVTIALAVAAGIFVAA